MNTILILLSVLVTLLPSRRTDQGKWSLAERNGMILKWKTDNNWLHLEMTAPQKGWVAIGFNSQSGLTGTNLLMGRVERGSAEVSDRYIHAPGKHEAISSLGGKIWPEAISGEESAAGTTVKFRLPLGRSDQWHHQLTPGKSYYVLMAFSRDDDFAHHSMMRTEIRITL